MRQFSFSSYEPDNDKCNQYGIVTNTVTEGIKEMKNNEIDQ